MTPAQLAVLEQPKPKSNSITPCFALALQRVQGKDHLGDMIVARAELGLERYGTYLQPQNGRCAYVDALQECVDLMNYLAQACTEGLMNNDPQEEIDAIERSFGAVCDIAEFMLLKAMRKYD